MYIEKLKVRPRQVAAVRPCTPQLAAMLACWSASGDYMSTDACAESAKALMSCMRTAVSFPPLNLGGSLCMLTRI
ncbi:hypothetical protein C8Q73DRAFT_676964 [Cubamyces lactineus]|nr:hypothetical protein C8Q73DRAFT_676964 [Cubamyces lactineus]